MNTFNVNVKVDINLSDDTKKFVQSLFSGQPAPAPVQKPVEQKEPVKQAGGGTQKPVPEIKTGGPSPAKVANDAKDTEAIREEIRAVLNVKVNEHRDAIRGKLKEYGAKSLTVLAVEHLDEFGKFIKAL